jgi:serine/threonine-protein kinase
MGIEEQNRFDKKNALDWIKIQKELFNEIIPTSCVWTNRDDIISVLNIIGRIESSNHSFLPGGGGLDLTGANLSSEPDCIELNMGTTPYICKPKNLQFESFGISSNWSYFRLNTIRLEPITSKYHHQEYFEDLIELKTGEYVSRAEENNDDIMEIFNRYAVRMLSGSIVIFSKSSVYNDESSTYDGRHNKMSSGEFREYIQKWISKIH